MMTIGQMRVGDLPLRYKLLAGAAALLMFACLAMAGSASKAQAEYHGPFCNGYNAAKWGQPGDRCGAPDGNWDYVYINGLGWDHSACVNAIDQNGVWWATWVCSSGPRVGVSGWFGNEVGLRYARGFVRNNTTGDSNHLYGDQT
jgi:hypothetical protein